MSRVLLRERESVCCDPQYEDGVVYLLQQRHAGSEETPVAAGCPRNLETTTGATLRSLTSGLSAATFPRDL